MFIIRGLTVLVMLAMPACGAWSQGYPNKPIRFVAPFPAGAGADRD